MGENIGTTITAQFASIGGNVASRRAAMAHSVFNVLGVLIIISVFSFYVDMIEKLVPGDSGLMNAEGVYPYIAAHIAMALTFFNVTATIVMLPFLNHLASLVTKIIPDKSETAEGRLKYIGAPGSISVAVGGPMIFEELKRMQGKVRKDMRHLEVTHSAI